jgi:hypothetical protein
MRQLSRVPLIVTTLAVAAMALAAPVSATTSGGFDATFRCRYVSVPDSAGEIALQRLVVFPPEIDDPSISNQMRGWQYIVRRDSTPTYRSNIQWRRASSSGHLAFRKRSVDVTVPAWPNDADASAFAYRVVIKIYRSTDTRPVIYAKGRILESTVWVDREFVRESGEVCAGRERST